MSEERRSEIPPPPSYNAGHVLPLRPIVRNYHPPEWSLDVGGGPTIALLAEEIFHLNGTPHLIQATVNAHCASVRGDFKNIALWIAVNGRPIFPNLAGTSETLRAGTRMEWDGRRLPFGTFFAHSATTATWPAANFTQSMLVVPIHHLEETTVALHAFLPEGNAFNINGLHMQIIASPSQ